MRRITSHFLEEEESEDTAKPLMSFDRNEEVRVLAGAFANMTAVVEEVHVNRARLKVIVNIFGRPTPLELDFTEVEKLS
jgi:transcriptional antiterminator NusG